LAPISWLSLLLLVPAGIGAGLAGGIAGLASLFSYPALLAAGLSPVSANVTNTVALVFNSVGSVSGSRPELVGQRPRLVRLGIAAVLGGAVGAVLLLSTPSGAFEKVVPFLIGLGAVVILIRRDPGQRPHDHHGRDSPALVGAMFLVAIYGGYFGAAAGVLLLALLLTATNDTLPRSNAVKNVTLGLANAVAAVGFAIFGPVRWEAVVPLALGCLIGGRIGPIVVRHAPAMVIRVFISIAGMGLAIYLGVQAYS
jgi:uncharacterized membrane protein YfcA